MEHNLKIRAGTHFIRILDKDNRTWKSFGICLSTSKWGHIICLIGNEQDWIGRVGCEGAFEFILEVLISSTRECIVKATYQQSATY